MNVQNVMMSVIVVDDQLSIVELCVDFLKSHGLDVLGVGYDGKDAVELYKRLKPDVVVMDMNMPKYDGRYAINEIKKINPNVKIIICSGDENDCKLIEKQVYKTLIKPHINDELLKAIRGL